MSFNMNKWCGKAWQELCFGSNEPQPPVIEKFTLTITVLDKDSEDKINNVTITVGDDEYTTTNGVLTIDDFTEGSYSVSANAEHYGMYMGTRNISKTNCNLTIKLTYIEQEGGEGGQHYWD